jgi:hypothetical protein
MAVSEIRLLVADDQRNVRGNRHRRAFDALNKGDWRTYGAEMNALKKLSRKFDEYVDHP